jgi:hypothetical protein
MSRHIRQMPLKYRMLLAGLITPITDFSCQYFIEKRFTEGTYNPWRTVRQGIVAACFITPSIYIYSTKYVARFLPGAIGLQKFNKHHVYLLLSEMFLLQPWLMFGIFYNLEFLKSGKVHDAIQNSVTRAPVMLNYTLLYFPMIMLAKFAFIAPFYRPFFFTMMNLPVALGVSFLNNMNAGLNPTKLEKIEKYEEFNRKYNFFFENLKKIRQEREKLLNETANREVTREVPREAPRDVSRGLIIGC